MATNAGKSVGKTTKGPSGTAAGRAAASSATQHAGAKRTGGSSNSARQPSVHKRGS